MKKISGVIIVLILVCVVIGYFVISNTDKEKTEETPDAFADAGASEETVLEVYVKSFECGYISHASNLRHNLILIENETSLKNAKENYDLAVIDFEMANNSVAKAFEELVLEYPVDKYSYLIEYVEVSCGGYYYHADKVMIIDGQIGFSLDEVRSPGPDEMVTEVMGGFCHMAAIPKEMIQGKTFSNVTYP